VCCADESRGARWDDQKKTIITSHTVRTLKMMYCTMHAVAL